MKSSIQHLILWALLGVLLLALVILFIVQNGGEEEICQATYCQQTGVAPHPKGLCPIPAEGCEVAPQFSQESRLTGEIISNHQVRIGYELPEGFPIATQAWFKLEEEDAKPEGELWKKEGVQIDSRSGSVVLEDTSRVVKAINYKASMLISVKGQDSLIISALEFDANLNLHEPGTPDPIRLNLLKTGVDYLLLGVEGPITEKAREEVIFLAVVPESPVNNWKDAHGCPWTVPRRKKNYYKNIKNHLVDTSNVSWLQGGLVLLKDTPLRSFTWHTLVFGIKSRDGDDQKVVLATLTFRVERQSH